MANIFFATVSALASPPRVVSFAPGLLSPPIVAEPVLRRLRAAGATHLAAVSGYLVSEPSATQLPTDEADLLREGELLDALLDLGNYTVRSFVFASRLFFYF